MTMIMILITKTVKNVKISDVDKASLIFYVELKCNNNKHAIGDALNLNTMVTNSLIFMESAVNTPELFYLHFQWTMLYWESCHYITKRSVVLRDNTYYKDTDLVLNVR